MHRLFKNRDFILILGLLLGLVAGGAAQWTRHLVLPALGLVMSLSTMAVGGAHLRSIPKLFHAGIWGVGLSYLLLSSLLLGISRLFTHDQSLWQGFVLVAAVPPAVAVIPFTDFLEGDKAFSLMATLGAYLAALFIMPLIAALHWESDFVSLSDIMKILLLLIVLPVIAGQTLRATGLERRLEPVKGTITNWSFFMVTYSIVGLNSRFIVADPWALLPVAASALVTIFGLGLCIELMGRLLKVDRKRLHSMVLLGTLKNYGLAGGLALALFDQRSALPSVVATTFMIIYIIWLSFLKRHFHSA